jgi:hypothetical protein
MEGSIALLKYVTLLRVGIRRFGGSDGESPFAKEV